MTQFNNNNTIGVQILSQRIHTILFFAANLEEKIEFNTSENRTDNVESSDEEDTEDLQARKERLENQLLFEKMKEVRIFCLHITTN